MCKSHGFTLLELSIVLVISTIFITLCTLSLNQFNNSNKALAHIEQIFAAIQLTRTLAITTGEPIIFCKSSDRKKCSGDWSDGQIIIKQNGELLRNFQKVPNGDTLTWNSSRGIGDKIIFLPSGATNGQQGSFYYCPRNSPNTALALILEQTGRIRISAKTAVGKKIPC
jgi:type IV fimbrial biogenesis protein FimT